MPSHTIILIVLSVLSVVLNGALLFVIIHRCRISSNNRSSDNHESDFFQAFSDLRQDLESLPEKFPAIPEIPNHSKDFAQLKEALDQISHYLTHELKVSETRRNEMESNYSQQLQSCRKELADAYKTHGALQSRLDTALAKETELNEQISQLEGELQKMKSAPAELPPVQEPQSEDLENYKANISHMSSTIDSIRGKIYQTTIILQTAQSGDSLPFIQEKIDEAISVLNEGQ